MEAVHLSLARVYQVQKSSNYFSSDLGEIGRVGSCNPRHCVEEASLHSRRLTFEFAAHVDEAGKINPF